MVRGESLAGGFSYAHNKEDEGVYTVAALIGSFLGTSGAIIILITSLKNRTPSMVNRIITIISIADVLNALPILIMTILHVEYHATKTLDHDISWWMQPEACKLQSFFSTTGAMLSFLWTFGLGQHVYLLITYGVNQAHLAYLTLYGLSILPFILNGFGYTYGVLGQDSRFMVDNETLHSVTWCWINITKDQSDTPWMARKCQATFLEGKGFEIFCYVGVTVYCLLTYFAIRRIRNAPDDASFEASALITGISQSRPSINDTLRDRSLKILKLLAIPLVFICFRIWGTIFRISCNCFSDDNSDCASEKICNSHFFLFMLNLFDPMQGLANCLLYWTSLNRDRDTAGGDSDDSSGCCTCPPLGGRRSAFAAWRARIIRQGGYSSTNPRTIYVPCPADDPIF